MNIATRSVDEVWKPLWGKRAAVPDRFNEATVDLTDSQLDAHRVYQPKTFVTSVFVNMLAGPIDMCNGLADLTQAKRVDEPSPVPSTLAGEGARTLIVFSGSTVIPDIPENYRTRKSYKWGQVLHFNKTGLTMLLISPLDGPCQERCVINIPARFTT